MLLAINREGSTEVEISHWEMIMDEKDNLKAEIKRLNSQATALKMDLHDLAEDLPTGWERIMEVATRTYETYRDLAEVRKRLASFGN
ncbi:MAG: CCE_0567 family metalloprotein [Pseudomonadota bacterium]